MRAASRTIVRVVAGFFVAGVFGAGVLGGCGGPSAPPPPPPGRQAPPPQQGKLIQDPAGTAEDGVVNVRWDLLSEHFERFSRRPASARKDAFQSRLDKYVEKIEIPLETQDPDEGSAVVEGPREELDPLKKYPADDYKVVAIMTGVGSPAALLRDPKGSSFTARVDTEVGNEGGIVESITQYEIVIRNPVEPKPVRLNIRPGVFDVSARQGDEGDLDEEDIP